MASLNSGGEPLSDRWIVALLLGYALLHLAARVAISNSVELDEAEQVLLAQGFHWGYARQPPFYSWLQTAAFQMLGPNVLALALVKASFLFAGYYFVFATTRLAGQSRTTGLLAVTSLVFIPQFAWELQRDLTHSVALLACAAATLYFLCRIVRGGASGSYVGLGLALGLGFLSKYNFAFFALPLFAAWISLPEFRSYFFRRQILISVVMVLVLGLPHLLWLWQRQDWFLSSTRAGVVEAAAGFLGWWKSFESLVTAILFFLVPLTVCYLFFLRRTLPAPSEAPFGRSFRTLLGRLMLGGLVLCLVVGVTIKLHFKERLLLPVLFPVSIFLALVAQPRWSAGRARLVVRLATTLAGLMLAAVPLGTIVAAWAGNPNRLSAPFGEFSARLKEQGRKPDLIMAENRWIGGNLKLHFPESLIIVPDLPLPALAAPKPNWLMVWNAKKRDRPPPALQRLAESISDLGTNAPRYLEARYKYAHQDTMRLGVVGNFGF